MSRSVSSFHRPTIDPKLITGLTLIMVAVWTILIAAAVGVSFRAQTRAAEGAATVAARSQFMKDVIYRRWNSRLGGVYAPVSPDLEPNPYLSGVPRRDVVTTDGQLLTLVNPAYMTRMVHELGLETEGIRSHITSLDPIRPENAPDPWEAKALSQFDSAEDEVSEVRAIDGEAYIRLMRPLVTEESCLACHGDQGYVVGDIRGGISVSVPLSDYTNVARSNFHGTAVGYSLAWVVGIGFIGYGGRRLSTRARQQEQAQLRIESLLEERGLMLREVQHRIKNNMATMASLVLLKADTVDDQTTKATLSEVANKFEAMMITYDRLYHSVDPDKLSLSEILPAVARQMVDGSSDPGRVKLEVSVDDITVDSRSVSNLGIITAEAVTNAVKYAFPDRRDGTIRVTAKQRASTEREAPEIELTIQDDGVGIPADSTSKGLGLVLIPALAEQLGGRAEIDGTGGTTIRVRFPASQADAAGS